MTALLEISDLRVQLGGHEVLRGVSLTLEPGTLVGLVGPNGAGKTTLLRSAAGLQRATGEIRMLERSLSSIRSGERASHFAYLPQEREIGWPMPVRAIVDLGRAQARRFGTAPSSEDIRAVDEAMARTDVLHLENRAATQLSGGERARVLIARALAQEAPLLLADEPVSGLDPAHRIALMTCFRNLAGAGRSVLASFHDLGLAARWCDRIVVLKNGSVHQEGMPETALDADTLRVVYGVEAHYSRDAGGMLLIPTELSR